MSDDFFNKEEPKVEESEKVKIGEKEYTQEELDKVVKLGEVAQEYETKWNRPIGEFYPDYTQKSQKLAEFEKADVERVKAEDEAKQKEIAEKAKAGELTPEETKQLALQQAKELGIITKEDFLPEINRVVANTMAAKQLIDDTQTVIADAVEKGQPNIEAEALLKYMDENGIKSPDKAYKLRFEPEIDKWKEEKIKGIRPSGFETQEINSAGSKVPPPPTPLNREDLSKAIRESLTRGQGGLI